MRRLLGCVLLLITAACADRQDVRLLAPKDLPDALYGGPERPTPAPRELRVLTYFVRTDSQGRLLTPTRLGALPRGGRSSSPPAEFATRELLRGVLGNEGSAGFRTAIPPETEVLGVSVKDGVADVNLTAQFENAQAELLHLLRLAQIVWTLTELSDVDAVRFRIHGVHQPVIDQNGVVHNKVGRGRYSRFAPRGEDGASVAEGPLEPQRSAAPQRIP